MALCPGRLKNPTAQANMDKTIAKLAPYQGTLGLVAIGLSIWGIVGGFIIWR